ncbi:MAG TPA: aminotransferase class I/II-fold pyridoxal phosphate-dependent enzyme [Opitutaceae bacterium]|nr:aminotransferase class I/II-fold pyridoxal phosphate-dependent enzyme [Opitutaceae bacterium]
MHTEDPAPSHWASSLSNLSRNQLAERAAAYSCERQRRTSWEVQGFDSRRLSAPKPWTTYRGPTGQVHEGINFLSSDYLGLSSHPAVQQAAIVAIRRDGFHSAGTHIHGGLMPIADTLSEGLGELLHQPYVSLHASGWSAGYDAMVALVKPEDAVLLDAQSADPLRLGAQRATRNITHFHHLNLNHAETLLQRLRKRRPRQTLFLVTSALFPIDGATADLQALALLAAHYGASLVVDVTHDLGCMGPQGGGELEVQSSLGKVDVIVGSFSSTFATPGGFVAVRRANVRDYLLAHAPTQKDSTVLGPAQIATAQAALAVVRSPEGSARRAALRRAVLALRACLVERHLTVLGNPGPIVTIPVDSPVIAQGIVRHCTEHNMLLSFTSSSSKSGARTCLELRLMAGHEPALMREVAAKIAEFITSLKENETRPLLSDA